MYNLHSSKQNTVHLPIEIQLADDIQFLDTVLNKNFTVSDTQNKMSDSDTTASDLNCNDLMRESSFESSSGPKHMGTGLGVASKSVNDISMKKSDPDVQAVINA